MATRQEINQKMQDEIINEELRKKRKKRIIFITKFLFISIILITLFFLYVIYFATAGLVVKEDRIIDSKIPDSFNGIKIIQISDLHYGTTVFRSELKKIVKEVNLRNPDIVVFTGDLIDTNYVLKSSEQEDITKELKKIKSTIGKYAISGEEDSENFITILNQSEFSILNNDYDLIYNNDKNPILLVGLSSSLANKRDFEKGYKYFNEETHNSNIYTICLLHETNSIDEILAKYNTDLFLAGHSHNGQVRIPFIGAVTKNEGSEKYFNEFYQLDNSKVYVSSGIGTNSFGFRLFDRPSINFFRLSNS